MRGTGNLTAETRELASKFVTACSLAGFKVQITDTLRTKEEQDALYAQGRTKRGQIVTNVKYPKSMHNWGLAFDICRADGKDPYFNGDGFFNNVGRIGESLGLEWGGSWHSFVDLPHFQLSKYGTASELTKRYGAPDKFIKRSNTLRRGDKGDMVKLLQALISVLDKPLTIDGVYGKETEARVVMLQTIRGLSVDGVCGKNTWKELFALWAENFTMVTK